MSALGIFENLIRDSLPGARIERDTAFSKNVEGCLFALHISHNHYEFIIVMDHNEDCWLLGMDNDYFDCEFKFASLNARSFAAHLHSAAARSERVRA